MDDKALYLRGRLESNELKLKGKIEDNTQKLNGCVQSSILVNIGTKNYEELENLPSINGTTLIGNYDEIDPTVPDYVKAGKCMSSEDQMTFADIKEVWDSVFKD